MYEENDYKIKLNWGKIFIKLILFFIVVGLIAYFFPFKKLNAFNKQAFNQNLNSMKEAAKNYYSNSNLPTKVGDSTKITLGSMISKNLVAEYVDSDNKECDTTESYAQITKTGNNEYVLKTQLSCGSEKNYLLETITSTSTNDEKTNTAENEKQSSTTNEDKNSTESTSINNDEDDEEDKIIENGNYDKDGNLVSVTEYEYKKANYSSTKSYNCPSGYILDGTICYKYDKGETIPATKLYFDDSVSITDAKKNESGGYTIYADYKKEVEKVTKYCPEGYTENNGSCYKYEEATVIPGSTTYTCPEGFTLDSETKKCSKTVDAKKHENTNTTYYCSTSSDTLSQNQKTCSYPATYNNGSTTCKCDDGSTPNGYNQCTKTNSYTGTYHAGTESCYCQSGEDVGNKQCRITSTYQASTSGYWSNPTTTTSSTQLSTYNNGSSKRVLANSSCSLGKCTYTYYTYTWITTYNNCNDGTSPNSSGTCTSYSYQNQICNTTSSYYTCNNGNQQSSSTCYETVIYNATNCTTTNGSYTCSRGGNLNGSVCSYSSSENSNTTTTYSCDTENGYEYNESNHTCTKTVDATPNTTKTKYSCNDGYTLEGTTCYKTTDMKESTTYKYSCPEGFTSEGKDENMKCSKYIESKVEYYCENKDDELKEDNKCYRTIKGSVRGYSCPSGYILNGESCEKKTVHCVDATLDSTSTTSYEYKWSTETSLDGWTKTGKTKQTTSSLTK